MSFFGWWWGSIGRRSMSLCCGKLIDSQIQEPLYNNHNKEGDEKSNHPNQRGMTTSQYLYHIVRMMQ
jgi:hypothetical protein